MSLTKSDRHDAIAKLRAEGLPDTAILKLLRLGARLHQLAEAECNGDYPCGNGQRPAVPCPVCESEYVPDSMLLGLLKDGTKAKICPSCKAEQLAMATVAQYPGFGVQTGGDPRGAVLVVTTPHGISNDWGRRGVVCG